MALLGIPVEPTAEKELATTGWEKEFATTGWEKEACVWG